MSTDRDVTTRIVRSWLHEDAREDADRILNLVLDEIDTTPQRSASLLARRFTNMTNTARITLAAAAVVVVAFVGYQMIRGANVANPGPSPSPTVSPSASQIPMAKLGLLDAGTYLTAFEPLLTMTVPDGWKLSANQASGVTVQPTALARTGASVTVCRDTGAVDAQNRSVPGIGTDAASIIGFLATRTDLRNMTDPVVANVGGLGGQYVDFDGPAIPPGAEIGDVPVVGPGACGINAYDQQVTRLGVFDLQDGGNVLIVIYSPPGDRSVIELGTSIVEDFSFDLQ